MLCDTLYLNSGPDSAGHRLDSPTTACPRSAPSIKRETEVRPALPHVGEAVLALLEVGGHGFHLVGRANQCEDDLALERKVSLRLEI